MRITPAPSTPLTPFTPFTPLAPFTSSGLLAVPLSFAAPVPPTGPYGPGRPVPQQPTQGQPPQATARVTPATRPAPPAGRRSPGPAGTGPASRRPGGGTAPPGRRGVRRPAVRPGTAPRPLPPHLWFAGRLLDVLTGRQPLTCLAGKVRNEAYQRLWELHAERTDWRQRVRGRTPYVRRCTIFRTFGGALEVAAVVALDQDVFRALAFRLEPGDEESGPGYGPARWHCTDVAAR